MRTRLLNILIIDPAVGVDVFAEVRRISLFAQVSVDIADIIFSNSPVAVYVANQETNGRQIPPFNDTQDQPRYRPMSETERVARVNGASRAVPGTILRTYGVLKRSRPSLCAVKMSVRPSPFRSPVERV